MGKNEPKIRAPLRKIPRDHVSLDLFLFIFFFLLHTKTKTKHKKELND
jgi:hypothetical protein